MSGSAALPTELFGNANDLMISAGACRELLMGKGFLKSNDLLIMLEMPVEDR